MKERGQIKMENLCSIRCSNQMRKYCLSSNESLTYVFNQKTREKFKPYKQNVTINWQHLVARR